MKCISRRQSTTDIQQMANTSIYAPPPGCDIENCIDCNQQYLATTTQRSGKATYDAHINDEEARAELESILARTRSSHERLQGVLHHHGDVILSRWRKKSCEWRQRVIDHNSPGLASKDADNIDDETSSKNKAPWWPRCVWMNYPTEDLARDNTLSLALLQMRSQHPPSSFAL